MPTLPPPPADPSVTSRFRFGDFILSPRQRVLLRDGREVPLIPRYFDLLVLLVQRRHEAVHRNDIFSLVWSDVVVSDGALTQAVRSLRRALEDDTREPRFIRTVSRHGYRFVYAEVVEEPDDSRSADAGPASQSEGAAPAAPGRPARPSLRPGGPGGPPSEDPASIDALLDRLCDPAATDADRADVAERLHALGTARVLARLDEYAGDTPAAHVARAFLRDARWDIPGAGSVPLWRGGRGTQAIAALVALRLRHAWRVAGHRWLGGIAGTALAGAITGAVGGIVLALMPGASAAPTAAVVLALLGAAAGATGAAGIGAGLAAAEALARSRRGLALVAGATAGGLLAGSLAHLLLRWTLADLLGLTPALGRGGAVQGLVLGAATGLGYAWVTRGLAGGGMAAFRGSARTRAALVTAAACALAAVALAALGHPMVGGLVNGIAQASRATGLSLAPLARALGEPEFGRVTAALLGAVEGAAFGAGLVVGFARRPRPQRTPSPNRLV